ncbi:MAG: hypothetical protein IJV00_03065 [Clostridia bacterium]|nr:hypothetical protein [Clostridia bacterium]
MNTPNLYKGIMGVMDLTYKDASVLLEDRGIKVNDLTELCRAVRGYSGPRYSRMRRCLLAIFAEWFGELVASSSPRERDELDMGRKVFKRIGERFDIDKEDVI